MQCRSIRLLLAVLVALYLVFVIVLYDHLRRILTDSDILKHGEEKVTLPTTISSEFHHSFNLSTVTNISKHTNFISGKAHYKNTVSSNNENSTHHTTISRTNVQNGAANITLLPPNYCLHVFYYMWYASEDEDGKYSHWNHEILPHWDAKVTNRYPKGHHTPPDDIGSTFYLKLGCYSSASSNIIEIHMQQLRQARIGVIIVSWYPHNLSDQPNSNPPDQLIPRLLDIANRYSIKVALHSEPYKSRTPLTFLQDIKYIHANYGNHPAYLKLAGLGKSRKLPVVYVYDSYLSSTTAWAEVLQPNGQQSIRNTAYDMTVIGILVKGSEKSSIIKSGFDGFYTYFASDGFSYGSSSKNWNYLAQFAKDSGLLFIPSAGPGYDDTHVRPWNSANSKDRKGGMYYKNMMTKAIAASSETSGIVSITSFNEWHEGTQIESAIKKTSYLNYEPYSPEYYLELTAQYAATLTCDTADTTVT